MTGEGGSYSNRIRPGRAIHKLPVTVPPLEEDCRNRAVIVCILFRYPVIRGKSSMSFGVNAAGGGETAALEKAAGNIVAAGRSDAITTRRLRQRRSTTAKTRLLQSGGPKVSISSISAGSRG